MLRHLLLGTLFLGSLARPVIGQLTPPAILSKPAAVYPPIARAAHISGTVILQITVSPAGKVISLKTVSGPPMLVGAAQDSVRKWTYKPLPTEQTFQVSVDFTLPPPINPNDEKIAAAYFPASDACHTAMRDRSNPEASAPACTKAADIASRFSDQERFIERRSAYVYAASAMLRSQKPKQALEYAEMAVAVVKQGHDDGSGSNAAYSVRAQAEATLGNLEAADADLTAAENFERIAIKGLIADAPQLVQQEYIPQLKNELLFHAQILDAQGRLDEAAAKRADAGKL